MISEHGSNDRIGKLNQVGTNDLTGIHLFRQVPTCTQYNLGVMYFKGVPQDYTVAHKWLTPAASRYPASEATLRDKAANLREAIATLMTPAQIAEAQRLAREWNPKKQ